MSKQILITGAAGFIGSHLVDRCLQEGHTVIGIDNLSRGSKRNISAAIDNARFEFFETDVNDLNALRSIIDNASRRSPIEMVWHMAANSDIAAGASNPGIDLQNTFLSTFNILAVMRQAQIGQLAFASSSAVYGHREGLIEENSGPMLPVSNYGAMKLAAEAAISAAVESFLENAWIFRFPNVVGPRATHGVIYDLIHKLVRNPSELEVLGNGKQQKPYMHSSELLNAMWFIWQHSKQRLNIFNIGTLDQGATVSYIAEAIVNRGSPGKPIRYTGGDRGWIGDVPHFQYAIDKLSKLGWRPAMSSKDAINRAVNEIYQEICPACN